MERKNKEIFTFKFTRWREKTKPSKRYNKRERSKNRVKDY